MSNLLAHPSLQFLNQYLETGLGKYRKAEFLKSPFESNDWECDFGTAQNLCLNWDIRLYDGSSLIEPRHKETLDIFKEWVLVQDHIDTTGGVINNITTRLTRVRRTLHLIDYMLLNGESLQLTEYGFRNLTENDIRRILSGIASNRSTPVSIYRWPELLSNWLTNSIAECEASVLHKVIEENPFISEIDTPPEERMLDLSQEDLVNARAFLFHKGLYATNTSGSYRLSPNTTALSRLIYSDTLYGISSKPIPYELALKPADKYFREYAMSPSKTGYERQCERLDSVRFKEYHTVFRTLGLLVNSGAKISTSALKAINQTENLASELPPSGRTKTLPQALVFNSLKNAIEFVDSYGEDIVDGYLAIAAASNERCLSIEKMTFKSGIDEFISENLKSMGVNCWCLKDEYVLASSRGEPFESSSYYVRFRQNHGFKELIQVLYGSVAVTLGTLMARRQGELSELKVGSSLDKTSSYLTFYNRKSGVLGKRQLEARPIPEIAADMIKLLERLQYGLRDLGTIEATLELFAYPTDNGKLINADHRSYCRSLDYFCDYFETPLNSKGDRYYIRQHQLRRFFAMLFFWGASFGGMETLRWFMGHTDVEHLYRYITEVTPGRALQSAKANYVASKLRATPDRESSLPSDYKDDTAKLADLLEEKFDTRHFELIDSEELEYQIEDWLEEGLLSVEPHFFQTSDGKEYRVLIHVKNNEVA